MDFMKPALSFEALYGSHNYKLNRPDSDEDTMYYYNPSFVDLYEGKLAEENIKDESTDRKHHDVRKLPSLFFKANLNFLEILYSCRVVSLDGLFEKLAAEREAISSMNVSYLYDGCMGMFNRNFKNLERDAHYVNPDYFDDLVAHAKKLGKHGAAGYRILDFTERYAEQGFERFETAFAYEPSIAKDKAFIDVFMAMRDGVFSYSELVHMLKEKEAKTSTLMGYFKENKVKEDANQFVVDTVQQHVQEHLRKLLSA